MTRRFHQADAGHGKHNFAGSAGGVPTKFRILQLEARSHGVASEISWGAFQPVMIFSR
jgi:hypothetical protein